MNYKENDFEAPKKKLINKKNEGKRFFFNLIVYYMFYIVTFLFFVSLVLGLLISYEFLPVIEFINPSICFILLFLAVLFSLIIEVLNLL